MKTHPSRGWESSDSERSQVAQRELADVDFASREAVVVGRHIDRDALCRRPSYHRLDDDRGINRICLRRKPDRAGDGYRGNQACSVGSNPRGAVRLPSDDGQAGTVDWHRGFHPEPELDNVAESRRDFGAPRGGRNRRAGVDRHAPPVADGVRPGRDQAVCHADRRRVRLAPVVGAPIASSLSTAAARSGVGQHQRVWQARSVPVVAGEVGASRVVGRHRHHVGRAHRLRAGVGRVDVVAVEAAAPAAAARLIHACAVKAVHAPAGDRPVSRHPGVVGVDFQTQDSISERIVSRGQLRQNHLKTIRLQPRRKLCRRITHGRKRGAGGPEIVCAQQHRYPLGPGVGRQQIQLCLCKRFAAVAHGEITHSGLTELATKLNFSARPVDGVGVVLLRAERASGDIVGQRVAEIACQHTAAPGQHHPGFLIPGHRSPGRAITPIFSRSISYNHISRASCILRRCEFIS